MITKVKFRAECSYDVDELLSFIPKRQLLDIERHKYADLPDEVVTLTLYKIKLETIKNMMLGIEDSHVMVETLTLESDYTGIRI